MNRLSRNELFEHSRSSALTSIQVKVTFSFVMKLALTSTNRSEACQAAGGRLFVGQTCGHASDSAAGSMWCGQKPSSVEPRRNPKPGG
jgi:hypothetical protein